MTVLVDLCVKMAERNLLIHGFQPSPRLWRTGLNQVPSLRVKLRRARQHDKMELYSADGLLVVTIMDIAG
jgi:hypothetical protein